MWEKFRVTADSLTSVYIFFPQFSLKIFLIEYFAFFAFAFLFS